MPWFLVPYKRDSDKPSDPPLPRRYSAMRDALALILADGGRFHCVEILDAGIGRAIVKVVGVTAGTISAITAMPGVVRIPRDLFNDPLSALTNAQRNQIRNQILACGYTTAEVNARFLNLANNTVADVLRFMATRRRLPRYDQGTDAIVCDGAIVTCDSVDSVDEVIR